MRNFENGWVLACFWDFLMIPGSLYLVLKCFVGCSSRDANNSSRVDIGQSHSSQLHLKLKDLFVLIQMSPWPKSSMLCLIEEMMNMNELSATASSTQSLGLVWPCEIFFLYKWPGQLYPRKMNIQKYSKFERNCPWRVFCFGRKEWTTNSPITNPTYPHTTEPANSSYGMRNPNELRVI